MSAAELGVLVVVVAVAGGVGGPAVAERVIWRWADREGVKALMEELDEHHDQVALAALLDGGELEQCSSQGEPPDNERRIPHVVGRTLSLPGRRRVRHRSRRSGS